MNINNENYLKNVISKHSSTHIPNNDYRIFYLKDMIEKWAGNFLIEIKPSGSLAKGTAIKGSSDIDLFISLNWTLSNNLREIYENLYNLTKSYKLTSKKQNVSIGIDIDNLKVDLVPGKLQQGYKNFHSLYVRKNDTWKQANIDIHINKVKNSGRIDEIKLTKIWRNIYDLDFPSFYLELAVIESLKFKNKNQIESNFIEVLNYLSNSFINEEFEDPSSSGNWISEQLSINERKLIQKKAKESLNQSYWSNIVW